MKEVHLTCEVLFNIQRTIEDDADPQDLVDEIEGYELMREAIKKSTYTIYDVEVSGVYDPED